MPGIRIQHPQAVNCRYTVVDAAQPYREPYQCTPPELGGCGLLHTFKTHHLNLDGVGAVIVSEGVLKRIKSLLLRDGFQITGEIAHPPSIGIGVGDGPGVSAHVPIVQSPNAVEPT